MVSQKSSYYLVGDLGHGFRDPKGELDEIKDGVNRQLRLKISANNPCQMAVIEALKGPKEHLAETNSKLRSRRDFIVKRINEIPGLSTTVPKGAFLFSRR